jgi:hypothetical protein
MMRRDYDIFERFPDGSTLWRTCVSGRFEANRRIQELKEYSENDFYLIDIQATEFLPPRMSAGNSRQRIRSVAAAG